MKRILIVIILLVFAGCQQPKREPMLAHKQRLDKALRQAVEKGYIPLHQRYRVLQYLNWYIYEYSEKGTK